MVLLWSWPWRSLRGQRSILPGMSVPLAVPRRQLPQLSSNPPPPSFLLLPALRIWAGLVGAGSWGSCPKCFSGETAAISSSLLAFLEDKTASHLPCPACLTLSIPILLCVLHGCFTFIAHKIGYPRIALY